MAKDAKGHGSEKRGGGMSVPDQHALRIARQALKMPDAMVGVMGGPNKEQAQATISRLAAQHGITGPAVGTGGAPDRVVGYVGKKVEGGTGERHLTDWHGNSIGTVRAKSSWPTPKSYVGSRMYSYEGSHKGASYHGRGFGEGMSLSLKKKK